MEGFLTKIILIDLEDLCQREVNYCTYGLCRTVYVLNGTSPFMGQYSRKAALRIRIFLGLPGSVSQR